MSNADIQAIEKLAKDCNNQSISPELCQHLRDWYGIELIQESVTANIPERLIS